MDELVKEYLIYRGFSLTVKSFDADLKADKDKSFRVCIYWMTNVYSFACPDVYSPPTNCN